MTGYRAAAVLAAALVLSASATAQSRGCDRSCLEGLLDAYVDAVVAHEPARLPLSLTVKFTENGQRLPLGQGLWHTATGKGGYALKLADVERGQAVLMGTILEGDEPTVLVARLPVAGGVVTEIETLVIRDRDVAQRLDEIGTPRRTWYKAVAPGEQLTRAELVRIGNAYFSGIERNDGKGDYPLAPDCTRLENFDNAGGASRFGTLADGTRAESGPKIPWTWAIAEVFKIEGGLIGPVESVLYQVPYGMGSGWSTWEESLSSEPR